MKLGEMSFGIMKLGELGEMSLEIPQLGELGTYFDLDIFDICMYAFLLKKQMVWASVIVSYQ